MVWRDPSNGDKYWMAISSTTAGRQHYAPKDQEVRTLPTKYIRWTKASVILLPIWPRWNVPSSIYVVTFRKKCYLFLFAIKTYCQILYSALILHFAVEYALLAIKKFVALLVTCTSSSVMWLNNVSLIKTSRSCCKTVPHLGKHASHETQHHCEASAHLFYSDRAGVITQERYSLLFPLPKD